MRQIKSKHTLLKLVIVSVVWARFFRHESLKLIIKKSVTFAATLLKFISSIGYIPGKLLPSRACLRFYPIREDKKNTLTQFYLHSPFGFRR